MITKEDWPFECITLKTKIFDRNDTDVIYDYVDLEYSHNADTRCILLPFWFINGEYKITIERIAEK